MNWHSDVLIVTATRVESKAIVEVIGGVGGTPKSISIDDRMYQDLGVVNGAQVFLTQSEMGTGGLGASLLTIRRGIDALSPSYVIMAGTAFGIDSERQSIGDILVSKQLMLYDLQRVGTEDGKVKLIQRGDRPHASSSLISRFRSADIYWDDSKFKVHSGLILSGEKLVDNIDFRDQLREFEPEAIGGEMEGAGLYAACEDARVDWILVKSVCDWADGRKAQDKEARQHIAAHNAAVFVLYILQHAPLLRQEGLQNTKESAQTSRTLPQTDVRVPDEAIKVQTDSSRIEVFGEQPSADSRTSTISASSGVYLNGCKYSTLQAAIDAAKPREEITVEAGTYAENILIDKSLTVKGAGANKTIINGSRFASVIMVGTRKANIKVILSGLTIKEGIGTSVSVDDNDANIYVCGGGVLNYGTLTIADSIISGNNAYYGGGIFNKGTVCLDANTHVTNNAAYNGGGIYNSGGAGAVALVNLNGCSIENNQATEFGAGIYSAGNTLNVYSGTKISGNNSGNSGGGVYLAPASYVLNMHGGEIFDNYAFASGGGIFSYGGQVFLNGGSVHNNTARHGAAAINASGGQMTLNGARIFNNTANKNGNGLGGGIMNSGTLTLKSGSVDHNTAFTEGGGIYNTEYAKLFGEKQLVHDNALINGLPDDISPEAFAS
jgi:nucleoside phosphorylase